MNLIGANPPPCVIIHADADRVDDIRAAVSRHAETIRVGITPPPRWRSWDVLITVDPSTPPPAEAIRVLQIGGQATGTFVQPYSHDRSIEKYVYRHSKPGHELNIPATLSEARIEFVKRYLVPALPTSPDHRTVFDRPIGVEDSEWTPLLTNADGDAVAVVYRPHAGPLEVWYLPEEAIDCLDPALQLAFQDWNREEPDRFPSAPDWTDDRRWMSAAHHLQVDAIDQKTSEVQAEIARLTASIEAYEVERDEVVRAANLSYQRRLLTDNDEPLVGAVQTALEQLGFTVVNLDKQLVDGEPRMGDLSVSDGAWTAIAEVKGYTKGAKANDLLVVGKHRRVYEKKHGDVQGMWYVANTFRLSSPDIRKPILDGADELVETFADDDGLVIDSRDLFDLLKQVEAGSLTPEAVRQALRAATGRFTAPVPRLPAQQ